MSQFHSASGSNRNWYNATNVLEDLLPSSRPQTSDNWVFPPYTSNYTWIQDFPLETLVSGHDSTLPVSGDANTMTDVTNDRGYPDSDGHPETPGQIESPAQNMDHGVSGYLSAEQAQDILGTDDWDPSDTVKLSSGFFDEETQEIILNAPRTVHRLQHLYGDDYFSNLVRRAQEHAPSLTLDRHDPFSTNSEDGFRSLSASDGQSVAAASTVDGWSDRALSVGSPNEPKDDPVNDDLNPDPDCIYTVSLVGGKRWYKCKTCSTQGTHRRRDMLRHVQTQIHKDDRFPCTICNVDFFSKGSLERHLLDTKAHKYLVKKNDRYRLRKRADRK